MMVTKQEQIACFLNSYVTGLPRCHGPMRYSLGRYGPWNQQRPSAEEVASELLRIAEFRALQLGNWLNTTEGEIILQAVEMVVPMFYAEDVVLLAEALKLAAARQQQEGRRKAFAGVAITLGAVGFGIAASRGAAA
jgi:hypothetical protein